MGPLEGFRIIALAGIGPEPMCSMLLADMGATVLRLERPASGAGGPERSEGFKLLNRGSQSIILDLKQRAGIDLALDLISEADALIEGFRPGTSWSGWGLAPRPCLARNTRLVYGRMTGWGQGGPLAQTAGHDINYIALTGALHAIGRAEPPTAAAQSHRRFRRRRDAISRSALSARCWRRRNLASDKSSTPQWSRRRVS